ncbi:hypothetical protein [Spirosoma pulveris]
MEGLAANPSGKQLPDRRSKVKKREGKKQMWIDSGAAHAHSQVKIKSICDFNNNFIYVNNFS